MNKCCAAKNYTAEAIFVGWEEKKATLALVTRSHRSHGIEATARVDTRRPSGTRQVARRAQRTALCNANANAQFCVSAKRNTRLRHCAHATRT